MNSVRSFLARYVTQNLAMTEVKLFEPNVETKKATFGMGCFWASESLYGAAPGVIHTKVGYTGGKHLNPTYKNLVDHTEVVAVDYDITVTTYQALLELFWNNHDTEDHHKTQYKSAIYYHDDEQKSIAESQLAELKKNSKFKLQTEILKAETFYNAELYHQKYNLTKQSSLCKALGLNDTNIIGSHAAARLNGYVVGYGTIEAFEQEWAKLGIPEDQANVVKGCIKSGFRGHC